MIRATIFGLLGGVIGVVSLVAGMLGLSTIDRDPTSSGGYFAMAVLCSPFALAGGVTAGVMLHYYLQRMGR